MCEVIEFPKQAISRRPENIDTSNSAFRARVAWVRNTVQRMEYNRGSIDHETQLIWAVDDFLKWLDK